MSNKNKQKFSKIVPNIKLSTRIDAEGNEIDVEIREDTEASQCRKKILDLLLSAGYFRVMIKNLSDFDKIVGGMTWCIEACEFDVDVDILFHENLTIGQKISLTERVVTVLPLMKCPFVLEPHQIQGLDFINIFPVIQWLVNTSVNLRNEKAERLRVFAVGQFHNHFTLTSSEQERVEREKVLEMVKKIEDLYALKRQYKRKQNLEPDDEYSRCRLTLMEYGVRTIARSFAKHGDEKSQATSKDTFTDEMEQDESAIAEMLKQNLADAAEEVFKNSNLTEEERQEVIKHYENLKMEMLIDTKQLSEQNKIKTLEAMELALEKKLQRIMQENEELQGDIKKEGDKYEEIKSERDNTLQEIKRLQIQEEEADEGIKNQIQDLILQNEKMKQEEIAFKEECKAKIEELYNEIEKAEALAATPEEDVTEFDQLIEQESEKLKLHRLQLAKKNRAVTSLQRQLDNIPDNVELAQYQRRFIELYNQISAKHKETKQFYALYNTLNDTHLYLDKELTLLNSIYDNYNQAIHTNFEDFIRKLGDIVEGASQMKRKIKKKCEDEKSKRDQLNADHLSLLELQRKYAAAVKQFKLACEKN